MWACARERAWQSLAFCVRAAAASGTPLASDVCPTLLPLNSLPCTKALPHLQRPFTTLFSLIGWSHLPPSPPPQRQHKSYSQFAPIQPGSRFAATLAGRPSVTPAIEARLEYICARHAELVGRLAATDPSAAPSPQEMATLGKEASDLEGIVSAVVEWRKAKQELADVIAMCSSSGGAAGHTTGTATTTATDQDQRDDAELRELAQEERAALESRVPELEKALLMSLLPRDEVDERGVVLEVRAGTGGEEASLFAGELFRMYERYASLQGWKFEVAEYAGSDLGGCKLASAAVSGGGSRHGSTNNGGIYGRLKFESGVHRVQRVPATESGGRVHTSAASVTVLPAAEDVDVQVRDDDLRIDVYRAGGAGGQHVNTTNSAVRVTHLPTGMSVAIQDERSQHKNKAKALAVLRARLFDVERRRVQAEASSSRKAQIGSGDRSERVRTYNFPQGRVTDHRVGVTEHGIESVLAGERLDVFVEALRLQHQADMLASLK